MDVKEHTSEVTPVSKFSFYVGAVVLATIVIWKWCRRQKRYVVPLRDISKGHHWVTIDIMSHTAYCNVCESLIVFSGYVCDACGIYSDNSCIKLADKTLFCKSLCGIGSNLKHHWVKGNLPEDSLCDVCDNSCGQESLCLADYRCCWCQRTVHEVCLPMLADVCNLGPYRSFLVPPYCIRLKTMGWKGKPRLVVGEVRNPAYQPWTPLIVIANRKSGSNDGDLILRTFRGILNPAQVVDLADLPPESGLEWCHLLPDHKCKVLVAGGDGTVGWVLSAIQKLGLQPLPEVGILPLGTGNDLARVLGWGEGHTGDHLDVKKILEALSQASVVSLDRWNIRISHLRHLGIRKPSKDIFMCNYASVGADALLALNFHQTRKSKFYLFSNRFINKVIYLGYGTKDFLERQCKNLQDKMELFIDGQKIHLPDIEAVVILNIPSYAAGVRPWNMNFSNKEIPLQRYDDGLLEAIGLYSSFHMAQLQMGLSEPLRFGQGHEIKIHLKERLPVQVDGEPWDQSPCNLSFRFLGQAKMLKKMDEEQ